QTGSCASLCIGLDVLDAPIGAQSCVPPPSVSGARPVHAASSSWPAASAGTARPRGCARGCFVHVWLWYTERASHTRHTLSPETGHAFRGPWELPAPPDR